MQENILNTQYYMPRATVQPKNLQCSEEPPALFICRICKKTFYNSVALQNHKNTQHDGETSCSENEIQYCSDQAYIGGFTFIPSKLEINPANESIHDGLIARTYTEDTTYLIVKIDGQEYNKTPNEVNCEIENSKTIQPKPKPLADLRGPFTCTFPASLRPEMQCRQIFFNCCDYSLHYREEHTKRRKAAPRCQVCERRLDRDLNPLIQLQAVNQVTFSCRTCGKTFHNSYEYDEHNRVIHAKTKPHQCPLCAKRFTQQGGLQQHMRMHSGIRPFACTFCPKAFTQKAGLDQHLRTHTKVKPFKCVICTKSFSQSVHLRQHMRTHTNIQPFECSVCERRFKQSSHLNFHMRSHASDGEFPLESYAQAMQQQNNLDFINFANVQPIQDGETMYYAAELAPPTLPNRYPYQSQLIIPETMLTL